MDTSHASTLAAIVERGRIEDDIEAELVEAVKNFKSTMDFGGNA